MPGKLSPKSPLVSQLGNYKTKRTFLERIFPLNIKFASSQGLQQMVQALTYISTGQYTERQISCLMSYRGMLFA